MLLFAKGKPLGEEGLDWLKIHLVNLTGMKKRCSNAERLQYANDSMQDILDTADSPLTVSTLSLTFFLWVWVGHLLFLEKPWSLSWAITTLYASRLGCAFRLTLHMHHLIQHNNCDFQGKQWWRQSDEPWQTLACCMEVAQAVRSPDPTKYICHFPVHQDGSCNGLQHYAALGRDRAGAESVNLFPFEKPSDVYSDVVDMVSLCTCWKWTLYRPHSYIPNWGKWRQNHAMSVMISFTFLFNFRLNERDSKMQQTAWRSLKYSKDSWRER